MDSSIKTLPAANQSSRLILGTVKFGMNYGLKNPQQVASKTIDDLLLKAQESGIKYLDTAASYGESEKILGQRISANHSQFELISKLPAVPVDQIHTTFGATLKRLNTDHLYGYLIHNFDHFRQLPELWQVIIDLKAQQKITKIGFSLYYPEELELILNTKIPFDLIQIPFNLLDRRFEPYSEELKKRQVEVHSRSVFLQGLLVSNPYQLSSYFDNIKEKLNLIKKLADGQQISMSALCLNFALQNTTVDYVVIGTGRVSSLVENIKISQNLVDMSVIENDLTSLADSDLDILVPGRWPK